MITEQDFNQWLIEYDAILRYIVGVGFVLSMILVLFFYRWLLSKNSDVREQDNVILFLISMMGAIVSIPFIFFFFIALGMVLKWIFIK